MNEVSVDIVCTVSNAAGIESMDVEFVWLAEEPHVLTMNIGDVSWDFDTSLLEEGFDFVPGADIKVLWTASRCTIILMPADANATTVMARRTDVEDMLRDFRSNPTYGMTFRPGVDLDEAIRREFPDPRA